MPWIPGMGPILTVPGLANTSAAIGTPIPGTGNLTNGIRQAGDGIAKTGYVWPALVAGPRFGAAYDLTGNQTHDPPRRRRVVLRPSGRQYRVLDSREPAHCQRAGSSERPAAERRHRQRSADDRRARARHLPVQRQSARLVAVERGRPEDPPLGNGRGCLVRRQPWLQPSRRPAGRHDGEPERGRHRCGVPAAEPGSDTDERGAWREHD